MECLFKLYLSKSCNKKALKATEKDKYVTAIPKEVFRAGVTYSDDKWSGMLTGEYISKRFSKTDNSDTVNGVMVHTIHTLL